MTSPESDSLSPEEKHSRLHEAWAEYGHIRCQGCGRIDLSDADEFEEAVEIWNDHIEENHE